MQKAVDWGCDAFKTAGADKCIENHPVRPRHEVAKSVSITLSARPS